MVRHTRQQSGVSPPRLPKQFEPLHLEVANVRDSDRYADGMIENCSLKGLAAYQLELKRISLRHVTLQDTRLEKLELTDILFDLRWPRFVDSLAACLRCIPVAAHLARISLDRSSCRRCCAGG